MFKFLSYQFFVWLLLGAWIVLWYICIPGFSITTSEQVDTFSLDETQAAMAEMYDRIRESYYYTGDIDPAHLARHALSSFVYGLKDPFSSYLPPQEAQEFESSINGEEAIEGIGAVLSKNEQWVLIEQVLNGSPAAQAGLQPFDTIIKVNGTGIQYETIHDVVAMIRGPQGTSVELSIMRVDQDQMQIFEVSIVRDAILIPSVSSKLLPQSGKKKIGYIWLSLFAEDTDERLAEEIKSLLDASIDGLILDVRGNGWGLLPEAVAVASHFLPKGDIVTKTKYRIYHDGDYVAKGGAELSHLPLVVLTDRYSASASEIIALALRENRCPSSRELSVDHTLSGSTLSSDCTVLLVWDTTFGKGTIQALQSLSFGGSLKLTVGEWLSPSGLSIHELGIAPDYRVERVRDRSQWDAPLNKAQELLSSYL